MGTNHLSDGYESSQLWVRIAWVRNVRFSESLNLNYENTLFTTERLCYCMGTNHLSDGYESSQLWVRIAWVRNARFSESLNLNYENTLFTT